MMIKTINRYNKLVSRNSITPADAGAITLISDLQPQHRLDSYEKVKSCLSISVQSYIETKLLLKKYDR